MPKACLLKIAVLSAAVGLSGCANLNYAMDEYGQTPMVLYEHRDKTYRLWDKPDQNKMMVSSNLGAAAGDGFMTGLTFGIVSAYPGEPTMRSVAEGYLAGKQRKCTVAIGTLIQQPQWEFRYQCQAPS